MGACATEQATFPDGPGHGVTARGSASLRLGFFGTDPERTLTGLGTGVAIGPHRVLTVLHGVPGQACWMRMNDEAGEDVMVPCRVAASGADPGVMQEDWAVLETDFDLPFEPAVFNPSFRAAPGARLSVTGFPGPELNPHAPVEYTLTVIAPPSNLQGKVPEDIILVRGLPLSDVRGMSGSPVSAWNAETGRNEVVGMLVSQYTGRLFGVRVHRLGAVLPIGKVVGWRPTPPTAADGQNAASRAP
jgi:hypothetical protein